MSELVIPTIGSTGYYELRTPFDVLMAKGQLYTCQGIRKISDYLANSEDPKKDIYDKYGITSTDWEEDSVNNMTIVSLQSDKGHWLYVPAKFVITYPITNGIAYRSIMLGVALPSIPVSMNLSDLETNISNLVIDTLGVTPIIKPVETSLIVSVTEDRHNEIQTTRATVAGNRNTDFSRYNSLLIEHQQALDKIQELQNYILINHTP